MGFPLYVALLVARKDSLACPGRYSLKGVVVFKFGPGPEKSMVSANNRAVVDLNADPYVIWLACFTNRYGSRGTRKKSRPRKRWQSAALKSRLKEISPRATKRLIAKFRTANAFWPPTEIAFVGIKDERVLELHARSEKHGWKPIYRYRVLAASGGAGPKLRQGDRQVDEPDRA